MANPLEECLFSNDATDANCKKFTSIENSNKTVTNSGSTKDLPLLFIAAEKGFINTVREMMDVGIDPLLTKDLSGKNVADYLLSKIKTVGLGPKKQGMIDALNIFLAKGVMPMAGGRRRSSRSIRKVSRKITRRSKRSTHRRRA